MADPVTKATAASGVVVVAWAPMWTLTEWFPTMIGAVLGAAVAMSIIPGPDGARWVRVLRVLFLRVLDQGDEVEAGSSGTLQRLIQVYPVAGTSLHPLEWAAGQLDGRTTGTVRELGTQVADFIGVMNFAAGRVAQPGRVAVGPLAVDTDTGAFAALRAPEENFGEGTSRPGI